MRASRVCVAAGFYALLGCVAADDAEPTYDYLDELEPTPSLASLRFSHAATLLADGRVMIVGGIRGAPSMLDLDAYVREIELFDPRTETFEQGAALEVGRSEATATRVADGRVIVLGGNTLDESTLPTRALAVEVWDPSSESFTTIAELPSAGLLFHCAVALGDEVLAIDECSPSGCAPLLVDPDDGLRTLGGTPSHLYGADVDCVALPDGRVLLAGGIETPGLASAYAEIYDPASESFERIGPMSTAFGPKSELVSLANGDVLIFGEAAESDAIGQVYSPSSANFTAVTGDVEDRVLHSLTLLDDGRVLIVGGKLVDTPDIDFAAGIDVFDPSTMRLTSLSASFEPRIGHVAVRLEQGPVLIAGGQDADGFLDDALLYR